MEGKKESKALCRERALENIFKTPVGLRRKLKSWLDRNMELRDVSKRWVNKSPGRTKVTSAQIKLMTQAREAGVSFRALEAIFHIRPQSGMAAFRLCGNTKRGSGK